MTSKNSGRRKCIAPAPPMNAANPRARLSSGRMGRDPTEICGRSGPLGGRERPQILGSVLEGLGRGAGADEVAVAVAAVDAAHRGPVLPVPQPGERIRALLPGVGAIPVRDEDVL